MEIDPSNSPTLSLLLDESQSDDERLAVLLPLVYDQLRAIAHRALAVERPDHLLQATALVHEALLWLVGDRRLPWSSRAHFEVAADAKPRGGNPVFLHTLALALYQCGDPAGAVEAERRAMSLLPPQRSKALHDECAAALATYEAELQGSGDAPDDAADR
ncbi:MAG: hypothetical protein IPJ41_13150 [Phycisphaerales bacterium]|nr:hypothetical protein [Phycisphaerales bacterium]